MHFCDAKRNFTTDEKSTLQTHLNTEGVYSEMMNDM